MPALASARPGSAAAFVVLAAASLVTAIVAGWGAAVLALAVIIPLVLAFVRRPQRGLLLLVALAPLNGLLLILPLPDFVVGWKEALVVATLIATWLCPAEARAAAGRNLPDWTIPVGGLLLLGVLSAFAVGGPQAIIGLKVGYFYLLAGLAAWRCPLDVRERDHLVTILMGVGFVCAIFGLVQQAMGPARLHQLGYEYNSVIRFSGGHLRSFSTFVQPFPFALFLMVVLLVAIPASLTNPSRLRNGVFLLAIPVYLLGILFTFVRAAWLGLAVGLIYLGIRRYRIVLAGIPVVLVAFLLFGGSVSEPVLSASSLTARSTGWEENISQIRAHPLGVGLGSSGAVAERISEAKTVHSGKPPYQPDNYYFKTLYDLGVLGLWLFVLILFGAFRSARSIAGRLRGMDRALAEGIVAMILAAAVSSMVATYFEIFPLDLLFWLFLAVVAAFPWSAASPVPGRPDSRAIVVKTSR